MRTIFKILCSTAIALAVVGCPERTEQEDTGGVLLEVEFVDTIFQVPVNGTSVVSIPTVEIENIIARPGGESSRLMDVQLNTVEVTYSRADTGTRVPPPFTFNVVGNVPVNGVLTYTNLPIMSRDQLERAPLSDLKFSNGAIDRETGAPIIKLNATVRVFGQTLTGKNVASTPRSQTFEFVPSLTSFNQ
jgi:hypothetical protein